MCNVYVLIIALAAALLYLTRSPKPTPESFVNTNTDEIGQKIQTLQSDPYLHAKLQSCARWEGDVVLDTVRDRLMCQLPSKVRAVSKLNYQLAGRMCDLDEMWMNQRCVTPGLGDDSEENLRKKHIVRGGFAW